MIMGKLGNAPILTGRQKYKARRTIRGGQSIRLLFGLRSHQRRLHGVHLSRLGSQMDGRMSILLRQQMVAMSILRLRTDRLIPIRVRVIRQGNGIMSPLLIKVGH